MPKDRKGPGPPRHGLGMSDGSRPAVVEFIAVLVAIDRYCLRSLPITSTRRVDLVVTELAVIRPTADGLMLLETMPGISVRDVVEASDATLQLADGLC